MRDRSRRGSLVAGGWRASRDQRSAGFPRQPGRL